MKLSEFIRRMRAIQDDMHDGGKPSVEVEIIENRQIIESGKATK